MKTKRIDFNIDLAKKIQAGEAQGRIVTREGQPARVICWDRKDEYYTIVALCDNDVDEEMETYTTKGRSSRANEMCNDLFLEVPDDTPQFQPYDKVLVRDNGREWICTFYSHFDSEVREHVCASGHYHEQCIPYEGNEHLVGTTDEPKEGGAE